jgi:nitrile hydratase subunit beta
MAPQFAPGARVRVIAQPRRGHIRTPRWLFGKAGVVEAFHGRFPDAEKIAYHAYGLPPVPLYFVAFEPREVWGAAAGGCEPDDRIMAELYEHWLVPA